MKALIAYKWKRITTISLYITTFLFISYSIALLSAWGAIAALFGVTLSFGIIGIFLSALLIMTMLNAKFSEIISDSLLQHRGPVDSYLYSRPENLRAPNNSPVADPILDDFFSDDEEQLHEVDIKYSPPRPRRKSF